MPGLLDLPPELRQMILQRAADLDEINLCTNHAFMSCWGPKDPLSGYKPPPNPQLPLHLICKTLTRDLNTINVQKLNLKFCCFGAVMGHLKDLPAQGLSHIQSVKFAAPINIAAARDKNSLHRRGWEFRLRKWMGTPLHIDVLEGGIGEWEEEWLVGVVACFNSIRTR